MNNPKFQKHLNDHYMDQERSKQKGRYGIIISYDSPTNTATVVLSSPDSDVTGDILTKVPCPVQLGIQTVAPEPGRPCWVVFKNDRDTHNAVISHYFNQFYNKYDHPRQAPADSGIPSFMLGM